MATVQQQGSRAGLITALVIFVILFVTTTIMWIYSDSLRRKTEITLNDTVRKYEPVISSETMSQGDYTDAAAARADTGKTAFEVVVEQRNNAIKAIGGGPTVEKALQTAADAGTIAQTDTGLTNLKGSPLTSIVKTLADQLISANAENKSKDEQLAASEAKTKTVVDAQEALIKEKDAKITELTGKLDAAVTELAQNEQALTAKNATVQSSAETSISQAAVVTKTAVDKAAKTTAENGELKKTIKKLQDRLTPLRVNTNEAVVQVPDGRIIRLPGNDIAYIDISDQVVPGMTFEVYDKNTGVPALGDGLRDGDMPKGKASIEVIHVGSGSSEARIIRKTLGESIVEGDFIANIVYDPKVHYNFVVYGDFDLNHDGKASAAEADVLKRMITQWGARTQEAVNIDTDFVVMGKEPVIPDVKPDEKDNAQVIDMVNQAQEKLNAYNKVRDRAIDLHIPIMNQNRFLYFIGFYNQSGR